MVSQFATLEFKPYGNEILIGFTPSNEAILGFITPFLINPVWLKGDGTKDLKLEGSLTLAASFADCLDDNPFFTHFLKGVQMEGNSALFEGSRDILLKTLNNNWGVFG